MELERGWPNMDGYLAAGPLIKARLKSQLSSNIAIQSTWGMSKIQENFDMPPAVLIMLEDDQPAQEVFEGTLQKVIQTWMALVVIHDTEDSAGETISNVYQALAGWSPDRNLFSPFRRVKSSYKPDVSPNGVSYFPLSFETSFMFNTNP